MKAAVVLAAGRGSRLAAATGAPKWLVPVQDSPPSCPAEAQLAALAEVGADVVHVVVGARSRPFEQALARWGSGLETDIVPNPHAADLNNWYSLLLGVDRALDGGADGVFVLNSDLYARGPWLADALARAESAAAPAALVVDTRRGRHDEAMKVSVDTSGVIEGIGKVGVDAPAGEYIGTGYWRRDAALALRERLAGFVGRDDAANHWYEHAIAAELGGGGRYVSVPTLDSLWVEIDDPADLDAARSLRL